MHQLVDVCTESNQYNLHGKWQLLNERTLKQQQGHYESDEYFFFAHSSNILPSWGPNRPDSSCFAHFQVQSRKWGVLGWALGCFVYVHIPERGLCLLSKEKGFWVVLWAKWDPNRAKWDPSRQFVRKVGKSALELGEKIKSYESDSNHTPQMPWTSSRNEELIRQSKQLECNDILPLLSSGFPSEPPNNSFQNHNNHAFLKNLNQSQFQKLIHI